MRTTQARIKAVALLLLLFPTLYAAGVRLLLRRNLARLRAGDLGPMISLFAPDVHFTFPGESSWEIDVRDREAVKRWEQRFLDTGLELEPREILVSGPPWNTRVVVHFDDHLTTEGGERIYENRGVIFAAVAWGRVTEFIVYEDTQKLGPLDEYLAGREPTPARRGAA